MYITSRKRLALYINLIQAPHSTSNFFILFWWNLTKLTLSNVSTNSVNHCCCCSCWLNMQKLHAKKKNDFYPHHWGPFFQSCILNRRKYNIACIKYFDPTKNLDQFFFSIKSIKLIYITLIILKIHLFLQYSKEINTASHQLVVEFQKNF